MKLRSLIIAVVTAASISACLNSRYESALNSQHHVLEISETHWSELELTVGHMTLSGKVKEAGNEIPVDWASGIEYAQIIAGVDLDEDQNPDYLRVIFTSNRVEWVGVDSSSSAVYDFEEDCMEEGYHCDPVIPAEGVGGVFEAMPGMYSAVTNTHCSASIADYGYRVSAYVVDFSGKGLVRVSDIATLDIICIQF